MLHVISSDVATLSPLKQLRCTRAGVPIRNASSRSIGSEPRQDKTVSGLLTRLHVSFQWVACYRRSCCNPQSYVYAMSFEPGQDKTCSIMLTRVFYSRQWVLRYTWMCSNLQRYVCRYPHHCHYMYILTVLKYVSAFFILRLIADLLFDSCTVETVTVTSGINCIQLKVFTTCSMCIFIRVAHALSVSLTISHSFFQISLSKIRKRSFRSCRKRFSPLDGRATQYYIASEWKRSTFGPGVWR